MKGPFTKNISEPYKFTTRIWYKTDNGQKERKPLPYHMRVGENSQLPESLRAFFSPNAIHSSFGTSFDGGPMSDAFNQLYNKAYSAWIDKVKGSLQLGADFGEAGQTLKMLAEALQAIKRPMRTLKRHVDRSRNPAGALKTMGNGWLTWHFGVRPLVETIHELVELADTQIWTKRQVTVTKKRTIEFNTNNISTIRTDTVAKLHVRVSGFIELTNIKTATLESLGLANPASVAWELVPYSFVVDWFYPIGLYLQSLSSMVGRKVTNGYSTRFYTSSIRIIPKGDPYATRSNGLKGRVFWGTGAGVERRLGVTGPVLQKTLNPWSTSITRGLTSISLLSRGLGK